MGRRRRISSRAVPDLIQSHHLSPSRKTDRIFLHTNEISLRRVSSLTVPFQNGQIRSASGSKHETTPPAIHQTHNDPLRIPNRRRPINLDGELDPLESLDRELHSFRCSVCGPFVCVKRSAKSKKTRNELGVVGSDRIASHRIGS